MTSFFPRKKNIADIFRLLLVLLFFGLHSAGNQLEAQRPFVTVWDLSLPGSGGGQLTFYIERNDFFTGVPYAWETIPAGQSGSGEITSNQVVITGLPANARIRLSLTPQNLSKFDLHTGANDRDAKRLLDVAQWGDVAWKTMAWAFYNCENMDVSSSDLPNLSQVTVYTNMFAGCKKLNGPSNIGQWNMQSAVALLGMFAGAESFNQPIGSWNTSKVENMDFLFSGAASFNQDISGWNVSKVRSISDAFNGARSFNQPLNAWKVDSVRTAMRLFMNAEQFNQDLGGWNTAQMTNMSDMFHGCVVFNGAIESWNTGKVTDMNGMFYNANVFNRPIGSWNTSNVLDMAFMFSNSSFNQPIGNWNTANVTTMTGMFSKNGAFNQPIGSWNTGAVTNMSSMFSGATAFNQPIGSWNTSKVQLKQNMFSDARAFNQNINSWNTSQLVDVYAMFSNAVAFNMPLDNWDMSKVTNMAEMFVGASSFNQPLNSWNTGEVTSIAAMFRGASSFNQPLNNWNTAKVEAMSNMFFNATSFNQDLSHWNVAAVRTMVNMFNGALAFNQSLGTWKLNPNVNILSFLPNCGMDCNNYDATLIGWSMQTDAPTGRTLGAGGRQYWLSREARELLTKPVNQGGKGWTVLGDFWSNCNSGLPFTTLWDLSEPGSAPDGLEFTVAGTDTIRYYWESVPPGQYGIGFWTEDDARLTSLPADGQVRLRIQPEGLDRFAVQDGPDRMRLKAVEQWGEARWKALDYAFSGSENMDVIAGDVPDLSQTESVRYLFLQCKNLVGTPVMNDWDVSSIRHFDGMFDFAEKFNQPIHDWNTSKAESMAYMFQGAAMFNQDISDWDVSKVTEFGGMFYEARAFNQPIGKWNTESARVMLAMFQGAESFDQPLNEWNVSSVTSMTSMFRNAKVFDGNISDWDVSKVEQMNHMFRGATNFNQNLNRWNTGSVVTMNAMFMQAERFNQPLDSWNTTRVENMGSMFNQATSFNQPVGGWDVGQVNDMSYMFSGADAFSQDLSSWRPAAVEDLSYMFSDNVLFNAPIGTWDVRRVKNFTGMLSGASSFDQNLGSWTFGEGAVLTSMLDNSGMSCENYDLSLKGWNRNADTPADLSLGAAGLTYWLGVEARDSLVMGKNWLIDGDTYDECDYASSSNQWQNTPEWLHLYPNPGQKFYWLGTQLDRLEVLDSRSVVQFRILNPYPPIDLSHLPSGIYTVVGWRADKVFIGKWLRE
jgi:surface protein